MRTDNSLTIFSTEVAKFKTWIESYPVEKQTAEWECEYPGWVEFEKAFALVNCLQTFENLTECQINNLIFAIARDNESESFIDLISEDSQKLIFLSNKALGSHENDAKWQFASHLGSITDYADEAKLLLCKYAMDENSYVAKRAKAAIGQKS
jgi:hypothetical protein